MNGNIECALVGRVVSVAPVKTSAAGKPWAAFKVAVGHGEDNVQWVRVVCFGDTAEQVASQLEKGSKVYVEGNLRLDHWKNQEGQDRSGLSVAAWKLEKLGQIGRNKPAKSKAPPEGDHNVPPPTSNVRRDPASASSNWQRPLDDLIPFAPELR